jgi:hypothetical protein
MTMISTPAACDASIGESLDSDVDEGDFEEGDTLYHSVGRGGEVSTLDFNNMHWGEDDEMLWTGWNELKTGRGGEVVTLNFNNMHWRGEDDECSGLAGTN